MDSLAILLVVSFPAMAMIAITFWTMRDHLLPAK